MGKYELINFPNADKILLAFKEEGKKHIFSVIIMCFQLISYSVGYKLT